MSERVGVTSFPLYWPAGRPRSHRRGASGFRDSNVYRETQEVRRELELLGARSVIVSSNLALRQDGIPYANQPKPQDPGVAVWFTLKGEQHALCCDAWSRPDENLRAIAKHVEAMRGQLRWKVATAQEAFAGFKALPERAAGPTPWEALGIEPTQSRDAIERAYKRAAMTAHPDHGGTPDQWHALQQAREQALAQATA